MLKVLEQAKALRLLLCLQMDALLPEARAGPPEASNAHAANAEIAEIDARLQALQNFLKAAKASCNLQK